MVGIWHGGDWAKRKIWFSPNYGQVVRGSPLFGWNYAYDTMCYSLMRSIRTSSGFMCDFMTIFYGFILVKLWLHAWYVSHYMMFSYYGFIPWFYRLLVILYEWMS